MTLIFAGPGHVFEYHLVTARLMARNPIVYSDPKALSAIGRCLPCLIQTSFKYSSLVISVKFQQNNKTANASLNHTQSFVIRARMKAWMACHSASRC